MVYENCKIYGPYTRKSDGRKHIYVKFLDGSHTTVSYPKYLMEVYLERYLNKDETVDHIDRDFNNNDISNLQILNRKDHAKLDAKHLKSQKFICPECNIEIILDGKKLSNVLRNNRRKNKKFAGPFCSRTCSGIYGTKVQNNKIEKIENDKIDSEFYYLNKKTSEV